MSPDHSAAFATAFLALLTLSTALRVWLALRHARHVACHRNTVPADFTGRIDVADHQRAADYTVAKVRVGLADITVDTLLLLALTLGGLLACIDNFWRSQLGNGYAHGLMLFASLGLISFAVGLPLSLYRTFQLEARFGFNKMTPGLYAADLLRQLALSVLLGAPLLLAVLWLMAAMGELWWLYVWLTWLGFNLLMLLLYPTFIAPLFNTFTPLPEGDTKSRIEALLARCGFASSGLFVMDGSKRSAHGNAYFTGFGKARRIVFFDTLLEKLAPDEVEAVLAHELGHFKHHHVWKRIGALAALSLAMLWLLGQLIDQPWFYAGLNVPPLDASAIVDAGGTLPVQSAAMALILFSLALPVFSFPFAPLLSWLSRRHEFEADAYAAQQTTATALVTALVKLYRDNAATLTPDPLHSLFYDSHPPANQRIAHLRQC